MWPDDPLPQLLASSGALAVLFTRPGEPVPVSYLDVGHRQGARLAADRLHARGCRSVVTIAGPAHLPASQDRLDGFHEAMPGTAIRTFPAHRATSASRAGSGR